MTDGIRITVSDIQKDLRRQREEDERVAALRSRPRSGGVIFGEGPARWWALIWARLEYVSWWILPVVVAGIVMWAAVIAWAYQAVMGVLG